MVVGRSASPPRRGSTFATQAVTILNDDLTGALYEQAMWKAGKALSVLVRERHQRRNGLDRTLTIDESLSRHARDDRV